MKKNKLILTSDYEVYGNGSGDIETCLINPTQKLMDICDSKGIRICFFVDVCEIWAFEECELNGIFPYGYLPATNIKAQLKDIITRGHDIQLHLHPQWLNYSFKDIGEWDLNYEYWRLPMVSSLDFGHFGKGVYGLLNKGKHWLENLIKDWDSNYNCSSFRAGAWCIQPEEEVLSALKDLGFKYESSVAPGMKFNSTLTKFDFSQLTKMPRTWKVGKRLNDLDQKSTLTEIPISTAYSGFFHSLYFTLLKRTRKNLTYPNNSKASKKNKESSNRLEKIKQYILPNYRMLDFTSGTTFEELKYITKINLKNNLKKGPIVAISHPKNFGHSFDFEQYLDWSLNNPNLELEIKSDSFIWR